MVGNFLKFANHLIASLSYVVPYDAAGELPKDEILSFGCCVEEHGSYQNI